jgi:hypothetical protein
MNIGSHTVAKHKHVITSGPDRCFVGPVSRRDENPAAHGGITYTQTCEVCRAERRVNANGMHFEHGDWYMPEVETA